MISLRLSPQSTSLQRRFTARILVCLILSFIALRAHPQTLQLLHSFPGSDGSEPVGGLTRGSDGCFYGTTWSGGRSNLGTVFKMSPAGAHTNGSRPEGRLVQGNDGHLYGTTRSGGQYGAGTLFRILMPGATVPVSLSATRIANQLMLSWPADAAGYHLEESTNVALADAWLPVAQSTVTNAGQISVTVPTTGTGFFRLQSP